MALRRHNGKQVSGSIWPGFVDAMTALLMILMFVLTIFMVVQFVLRETITGQDVELEKKTTELEKQNIELEKQSTELDNLSAQIAGLADALGLEQVRSKGLTGELASSQDSLQSAQDQITQQTALISSLTNETAVQKNRIASFEQQVAGLLAERSDLSGRLKQTEASLTDTEAEKAKTLSEKEAVQLALAQARSEIDQQTEQARLAAAKREALDALIADLKTDAAAKDTKIASIENQLSEKEKQRLTQAAALLVLQKNLKSKQADLSKKQADLNKLQAEAAAKDIKIASIKTQLSEKEKQRLTQAAALLVLQKNLKSKQADLNTLQVLVASKDTKIAAIETQLSDKEKQRLKEAAEVLALQERLKSKVDELNKAQTKNAATDTALNDTRKALSDAEKLRLVEMAATKALREKLKNSEDALTAMTLALEAKRKQAEDTLTLLAAAEAAKTAASKLAGQHLSDQQKQAALLAEANKLLKNEKALSTESQRKVALLNQQTTALRGQLNALQGLLDDAKAKDSNAQIQIKSLGTNLNSALARVAAEQKRRAELEEAERKRLQAEAKDLKKFRSEFFGRLRDVLGAQKGVRIVGDRFVFSSEVLFTAGSAELGIGGRTEIRKVADIINEVADKIPPGIDWILRVDGHTDNIPLSGNGLYHDNWELSQARALSVVKYMINDLGFPSNRLAAAGFGEFQPIAQGDSPEALAQNRRIELKFTEK